MKHLIVDLYKVWAYDAHAVKTGPVPMVTNWNIGTKKTDLNCFLSETERRRALSVVYHQHLLCGHFRGHIFCSINMKFGLDEISDEFGFGSPGVID